MRLKATFTQSLSRDLNRIRQRRLDERKLMEVINLMIDKTPDSIEELRRRHRMHRLKGVRKSSSECHVANPGGWLIVWLLWQHLLEQIYERIRPASLNSTGLM